MSITATAARAEIKRRADNRERKAAGKKPKAAASPEAMRLGGAELREIAEKAKAKATPARKPKAKPTPKVKPAPKANVKPKRVAQPGKEARERATERKRAYWKATGENMTYRDACILEGTLPAREISESSLTAEGIAMTVAEEHGAIAAKYGA